MLINKKIIWLFVTITLHPSRANLIFTYSNVHDQHVIKGGSGFTSGVSEDKDWMNSEVQTFGKISSSWLTNWVQQKLVKLVHTGQAADTLSSSSSSSSATSSSPSWGTLI